MIKLCGINMVSDKNESCDLVHRIIVVISAIKPYTSWDQMSFVITVATIKYECPPFTFESSRFFRYFVVSVSKQFHVSRSFQAKLFLLSAIFEFRVIGSGKQSRHTTTHVRSDI